MPSTGTTNFLYCHETCKSNPHKLRFQVLFTIFFFVHCCFGLKLELHRVRPLKNSPLRVRPFEFTSTFYRIRPLPVRARPHLVELLSVQNNYQVRILNVNWQGPFLKIYMWELGRPETTNKFNRKLRRLGRSIVVKLK